MSRPATRIRIVMTATFAHPVQTSIPCLPDTTPGVFLGSTNADLKHTFREICRWLPDHGVRGEGDEVEADVQRDRHRQVADDDRRDTRDCTEREQGGQHRDRAEARVDEVRRREDQRRQPDRRFRGEVPAQSTRSSRPRKRISSPIGASSPATMKNTANFAPLDFCRSTTICCFSFFTTCTSGSTERAERDLQRRAREDEQRTLHRAPRPRNRRRANPGPWHG